MRTKQSALFFFLSLLCSPLFFSCQQAAVTDDAERVRKHYSENGALSLTAELRTDFGDRVVDFTIAYEGKDEGATLTVLAPELIGGITAEVADDGATLHYDGATLELGALPGTGFSPMETLPFLLEQWKTGYATQTGYEKRDGTQSLLIVYRSTQNGVVLEQKALFDPETLAPVHSELSADGVTVVTCSFASQNRS